MVMIIVIRNKFISQHIYIYIKISKTKLAIEQQLSSKIYSLQSLLQRYFGLFSRTLHISCPVELFIWVQALILTLHCSTKFSIHIQCSPLLFKLFLVTVQLQTKVTAPSLTSLVCEILFQLYAFLLLTMTSNFRS